MVAKVADNCANMAALGGGRMKDRFRIKEQLRVRRNIPAHIAFWTFVLLLLYIFWKAFSGNPGQ